MAMASSNSFASIHSRSSTHRRRSRAMWVGGPPKPMQPRRSHSLPMVPGEPAGAWSLLDVVLAAHGVSSPSTSRANSRNWCLVDSSALRPLAVAT